MEAHIPLESLIPSSPTSAIASVFLVIYGVHLALVYFDVPILSVKELLWNAILHSLPASLLLDPATRKELQSSGMLSQVHAAKSDALRRILGFGGVALLQNMSTGGEGTSEKSNRRWSSVLGAAPGAVTSEAPAGLGNWDNSCYQNSVLQALAASDTLQSWLRFVQAQKEEDRTSTNGALQETITKLRDASNNGKHIWTPAKLKSMSSWQQQDAQEYFSKIMDELDKEAAKTIRINAEKPGLECAVRATEGEKSKFEAIMPRNPLEGLIAQRVACTSCGFSEGYSMIPFNCLTVPLGPALQYDIAECLDEYTKREAIEGVECRRCTLLRAQDKIKAIAAASPIKPSTDGIAGADATLALPPELRAQIAQRLQAIQQALADDDYTDKTLKQDCQISAQGYVSSTKTREAVIGRAPNTLVIHVNRSLFDEMTGTQRKNYAHVRYPLCLDLTPWMLSAGHTPAKYTLRAVVTHYGRHENGHYICYRQHPTINTGYGDNASDLDDLSQHKAASPWWRLSDEDVSSMTEAGVLEQGGVFMLFYEREPDPPVPKNIVHVSSEAPAAATLPDDSVMTPAEFVPSDRESSPSVPPLRPHTAVSVSSPSVTSESDTDFEYEGAEAPESTESKQPHAPVMRTAAPVNVRHDISIGRSMMSV